MSNESRARRDAFLALARDAVRQAQRQGEGSEAIAARIHTLWNALDESTWTADPDFLRDERSGVEALAFVVYGAHSDAEAGIILRLPGEYPDSFEVVAVDEPIRIGPGTVRRAFFHDRDDLTPSGS